MQKLQLRLHRRDERARGGTHGTSRNTLADYRRLLAAPELLEGAVEALPERIAAVNLRTAGLVA